MNRRLPLLVPLLLLAALPVFAADPEESPPPRPRLIEIKVDGFSRSEQHTS